MPSGSKLAINSNLLNFKKLTPRPICKGIVKPLGPCVIVVIEDSTEVALALA